MANPFQSIADGVSDFFGEISDAWTAGVGKNGQSGQGNFLSYPQTLGNNYSDSLSYNSDDLFDQGERAAQRAEAGFFEPGGGQSANEAPEPFIMFEFMRIQDGNWSEEFQSIHTEINLINANPDGVQKTARPYKNDPDAKYLSAAQKQQQVELHKELVNLVAQSGKRMIDKTVALYMTPSISVNDSMNYDQESRATAAMWDQLDVFGDDKKNSAMGISSEDVMVGGAAGAETLAAGLGGILGKLGSNAKLLKKVPMVGKYAAIGSAAVGYGAGAVIGDEMLRSMGKALNPNEYMQYKNTVLRSFSFNWKFLPDNAQESVDCANIVKIFRAASHADRKSAITLTVPDHVVLSFHGVSSFPSMPPMVISNVSVTYNPNAASFFKQNNHPVEIDLSITLQEIMPIYRADVEEGGF
jgi:hypothetical protein